MKATNLMLILPFASLFVVCSWAFAQNIPQGFDLFGEFGPSCLYGNVHSSATGEAKCEAGRFFGGVGLRLTRHDAIEGSYSYSPDVFNEAYPLVYFNGRLTSHSVNYVRYLAADPHVQPFATAGVGYESFQGIGQTSSGARVTGDTEFAWNYGAGIEIIPFRFFAVRFEVRDYAVGIPVFHSSSLHNVVPSLGIVFRCNRNRKL